MMHTKTMEGLAGASANMKLLNTPFRVYKEARRKGDTGTMERAMGYVDECSDKADAYMSKAEKGMKEDAKEAREKAEAEREKAVRKRREEQEELERRIEEGRNQKADKVEISEDGKVILKEKNHGKDAPGDGGASAEAEDAVKTEPVIYTKTGEAGQGRQESGANLSVSV